MLSFRYFINYRYIFVVSICISMNSIVNNNWATSKLSRSNRTFANRPRSAENYRSSPFPIISRSRRAERVRNLTNKNTCDYLGPNFPKKMSSPSYFLGERLVIGRVRVDDVERLERSSRLTGAAGLWMAQTERSIQENSQIQHLARFAHLH